MSRASAQDVFTNVHVLPGNHSSILIPDSPGNGTFPELKRLLLMHLMALAETENVPVGQSGGASAGPTRAGPALETGSPLIEETLDLTLTSEGIQVVRVTEGRADDRTLLAVPSTRVMEEYHRALSEAAELTVSPEGATTRRIHELVLPMQRALLAAVPNSSSSAPRRERWSGRKARRR